MKFPHRKNKNQRGFSNVQIAIGILVTVVSMVAAVGGYQYVYQAKVNNDLLDLSNIAMGVKNFRASVSESGFQDSTPATLAAQGWIPKNRVQIINGNTTLTSQWANPGISMRISQMANPGDAVQVTYFSVPDFACKELAIKAAGIVDMINIEERTVKDAGAPIDVLALTEVCETTGFGWGGVHDVVFTISAN